MFPVLEFLASNTVASVTKFFIEKVVEYKKNKGTDKEVEALNNQLETYKEKTQFMEKEMQQFKEIAEKLETKLGSGYISENSYMNWSFDTIKPMTSAFKIEVWTEKGDYRKGARDITVVPKTKSYRMGDKINLYFQSEKDCYLTLINYGTSGKMTVLLPNALTQDNLIKEGRIYAIPGEDYPFDYLLTGPAGTERIKAIGTTRKINLMDMKFNKDEVFKTSTARDISVVAKKIESVAPGEWAETMCEFEVR
jgi:3D (Asp-Asp-Asp) domain-containing protein